MTLSFQANVSPCFSFILFLSRDFIAYLHQIIVKRKSQRRRREKMKAIEWLKSKIKWILDIHENAKDFIDVLGNYHQNIALEASCGY